MATERAQAIEACLAFIHSLDREAPLLDPSTVELHLDSALGELSTWRAFRRLITVTLDPGKFDYLLPADFIVIDVESFNHAVNPAALHYSWTGQQFELGYVSEQTASGRQRGMPSTPVGLSTAWNPYGIFSQPYGSPQSVSFGVLFIPGTRFEFAQTDAGAPIMYTSPRPAKAGDVKFLAECRHQITKGDTSADPVVPSINTVRQEDRGLLWAKVGQLACLSLSRSLAANRYAPGALVKTAKLCEEYFMSRAATFTYGA